MAVLFVGDGIEWKIMSAMYYAYAMNSVSGSDRVVSIFFFRVSARICFIPHASNKPVCMLCWQTFCTLFFDSHVTDIKCISTG